MTTITYRQATQEDVEGLLELLVDMWEENAIVDLDIDKTIATVTDVVDNGMCIVALDGEEVVGSIGMYRQTFWYSSDEFAADRWFFCKPSHRRTSIGLKLLRAVQRWAESNGLPLLLGVMSPVDASRKDKLYSGMKYLGSSWALGFPRLAAMPSSGRP